MKNVYTCYYTSPKLKNIEKERLVSISRSCPYKFDIHEINELKPTERLLNLWKNKKINWDEYEEEYSNQLESYDMETIFNNLNDGDILLCYEKDSSKCHRSLVREYINNLDLNVNIKEL